MAAALDELPIDGHVLTSTAAKYRLKWTLTEFSKLPNNAELVCPEIKAISPDEWQLIFLNKCESAPYLYFVNNMQHEIKLDYEVTFYTSEGVSFHTEKAEKIEIPEREKKDIIPSSKSISKELKDDSLLILCNFTFCGAPTTIFAEIHPKREKLRKLPQLSYQQKLLADLKSLLQKKHHADVFLLAGEEQMKCHKCILSARSPVFQKMFQQDIDKEDQKTVRIDDVKFPTLQKLIDFIYCGVVDAEEDIELTYDLYYAADKYEILELRDRCADTFMRMLSEDNAIRILLWADRHNDDHLKSGVNDFIRKNFEVISDTEAWDEFLTSYPKVAIETMKCVTKWYVSEK